MIWFWLCTIERDHQIADACVHADETPGRPTTRHAAPNNLSPSLIYNKKVRQQVLADSDAHDERCSSLTTGMSQTIRTGWATKRGQVKKNWKRRCDWLHNTSHPITPHDTGTLCCAPTARCRTTRAVPSSSSPRFAAHACIRCVSTLAQGIIPLTSDCIVQFGTPKLLEKQWPPQSNQVRDFMISEPHR